MSGSMGWRGNVTPNRWLNRLLKKACPCFDRLSTNGKSPAILTPDPFALSLSKGERGVFPHPDRRFAAYCSAFSRNFLPHKNSRGGLQTRPYVSFSSLSPGGAGFQP